MISNGRHRYLYPIFTLSHPLIFLKQDIKGKYSFPVLYPCRLLEHVVRVYQGNICETPAFDLH